MTTLALCNNAFALQEKSSSSPSPPPNLPGSEDVDSSYPQTASLQRPSYSDMSRSSNEPRVNLADDFIPLDVNRDRPPITRTTSRQRGRSHISWNSESQHSEVHPPTYRPLPLSNQQFPSSPLAGSSQVLTAEELTPLDEDYEHEDGSIHLLSMRDKRRLMFRIFFPEAFHNILTTNSTDARFIIDTHARLPLHQMATLIEVLGQFCDDYPLWANEPEDILLPLRALALIINKILIAGDADSLNKISDSIEDEYDQIPTSLAYPKRSSADPLPESNLEVAVETLEEAHLRYQDVQPYRLPLTEENIPLINELMNRKKEVLDIIANLAEPLPSEEPVSLELHSFVEEARKQNIIYVFNKDKNQSVPVENPNQEIALTSSEIEEYTREGVSHLQIATLPSSLASPALTTFLIATAEQTFYSTTSTWKKVALFLFDGMYISKPFARKNNETLRLLTQVISLLASEPPPVIQDSSLTSSIESFIAIPSGVLSTGSRITAKLLNKEELPMMFSLQDEEGGNWSTAKTTVTLVPSNVTSQEELAGCKLEESILGRMDDQLDNLLDIIYFSPPTYQYNDIQEEENSWGRFGPPSGTEEDEESDFDSGSDSCAESKSEPDFESE